MYHLTWPCTGMNHLSTAETFRTSNPPWLISAHSPFPTMDEVLTGACFKHFLHHRGLATRPETSAPTKRSAGSQRPLEDANLAPQGNSRATQRPSFHTASPSPRSLSNRTRPDPRSLSQGSSPPRELSRRASLEYYPQLRGPGHRRTALVQGASPIASAREHMSAERGSRADGRRPRASSSRADSTELKQFRCEYCGLIFGRKHHKERHVDNLHRKVSIVILSLFRYRS